MARNWSDDEELLLDLREAVRPDPREQQVITAAAAIRAWRTADVDRALAALLYDSHLDRVSGVRGPLAGVPRHLVFALGDMRVEIEVGDDGIEGQLIPPEPGRVWLHGAAGPVAETVADEVGCFTFPAARSGPLRIECEVDGRRLATEWIGA